jgi:hypothetical protein
VTIIQKESPNDHEKEFKEESSLVVGGSLEMPVSSNSFD